MESLKENEKIQIIISFNTYKIETEISTDVSNDFDKFNDFIDKKLYLDEVQKRCKKIFSPEEAEVTKNNFKEKIKPKSIFIVKDKFREVIKNYYNNINEELDTVYVDLNRTIKKLNDSSLSLESSTKKEVGSLIKEMDKSNQNLNTINLSNSNATILSNSSTISNISQENVKEIINALEKIQTIKNHISNIISINKSNESEFNNNEPISSIFDLNKSRNNDNTIIYSESFMKTKSNSQSTITSVSSVPHIKGKVKFIENKKEIIDDDKVINPKDKNNDKYITINNQNMFAIYFKTQNEFTKKMRLTCQVAVYDLKSGNQINKKNFDNKDNIEIKNEIKEHFFIVVIDPNFEINLVNYFIIRIFYKNEIISSNELLIRVCKEDNKKNNIKELFSYYNIFRKFENDNTNYIIRDKIEEENGSLINSNYFPDNF